MVRRAVRLAGETHPLLPTKQQQRHRSLLAAVSEAVAKRIHQVEAQLIEKVGGARGASTDQEALAERRMLRRVCRRFRVAGLGNLGTEDHMHQSSIVFAIHEDSIERRGA